MARSKKEKEFKVFLKLKRPHKVGFRLGRHVIKMGAAKEYVLNEKEHEELQTTGPQAWIKVVSKKEMDAAPKSNAENKEMQAIKKELKDRVELKGDESLEELKALLEEVKMFDALVETCKEKGIEVSGEESVEELEALITEHDQDSEEE